ncbi:Hypothetical predicted protein [Pelobates cultripes]|uniref:Uncharacterized protein n=1 Tax=Pelobates cultripes TaxID=61616 RepID=A0AAD1WRR7_PELCU|nr:Hypothetical predicted protein [Pelobates cultripes]
MTILEKLDSLFEIFWSKLTRHLHTPAEVPQAPSLHHTIATSRRRPGAAHKAGKQRRFMRQSLRHRRAGPINCDAVQDHEIQKEEGIWKETTELQLEVNKILNKIDTMIPKITFSHFDNTTDARKSMATLVNPRDKYCVGDSLVVKVDMFDHLGKRKTHGGDFLMARIFSSNVKAGASGKIEDLENGTYNIHFTLFWPGVVNFSIHMIHPSEGVSALWQARNKGYGYVNYTGKFLSHGKVANMKCGFNLNGTQELCEYSDLKEEEYFYCMKPENMSCGLLVQMMSLFVDSHSYLSDSEKQLFNSNNIRIEIAKTFGAISVSKCGSK